MGTFNTMKKYIILNIFFAISIVFIQGCKETTSKDYGYKAIVSDYNLGVFEASLVGHDERIEHNLSIRGNKYRLHLHFISPDMNKTFISIKSIQLFSLSKEVIFKENNKKIISKVCEYSNENIAFMFFKDINIPIEKYDDILLVVDFSIGKEEKSYKIEQLFIKNPTEEKITFWDVLMGV